MTDTSNTDLDKGRSHLFPRLEAAEDEVGRSDRAPDPLIAAAESRTDGNGSDELGGPPEVDPGRAPSSRSRRGPLAVAGAAVGALLIGGFALATRGGDDSSETAVAAVDEESTNSEEAEAELTPSIVDLGEYEDDDTMRIEIPLDAPEEVEGGDGTVAVNPDLEPLRMVIADGSLTLQGTAQSQEQADAMVEEAELVFGADMVEADYAIDPAAPDAATGVVVQKPIVFETGSAEIREEFKPILDACADVLRLHPKLVMNVAGHTDDSGSAEANLALAEARAQAVIDYYIEQGVESETFELVSFGSDAPIDSNDTESGRESNRRTDLEFVGIFDDVLAESE